LLTNESIFTANVCLGNVLDLTSTIWLERTARCQPCGTTTFASAASDCSTCGAYVFRSNLRCSLLLLALLAGRAVVARGGVAVETRRAVVCAPVGRDAARRVGVVAARAASLSSAANDGALLMHTHSAALGERVHCQSALMRIESGDVGVVRELQLSDDGATGRAAASLNRFAPLPINADAVG
jgi:hypothetical protein